MKRVTFYFDGFNFYNGFREKTDIDSNWKDYYWLDFVKFSKGFLNESFHHLVGVKYFTAPPSDNQKRSRQSALLSANKLLNPELFQVFNGRYQNKTINCRYCKKDFLYPEEKRTDVNISVNMMLDCFHDRTDSLILVTADSDQVPTVKAIKEHFSLKEVKVYFPPERYSTELLTECKPIVFLGNNEEKFKKSVMPVIVQSGNKTYTRPETWKK